MRDPKVYLFDEPLSNLDAALRVATRIEIAQLKEAMPNSTMIYVTHDQVEAMTLASRIVVLAGGGISQVGSPLELYERPENEFVAQFIGSPSMNLLPGEVVGTGARDHGPAGQWRHGEVACADAGRGQGHEGQDRRPPRGSGRNRGRARSSPARSRSPRRWAR